MGCTSHFLSPLTPCDQLTAVSNSILAGLPNGAKLQATHSALLPTGCPLPPLSLRACQANVFPAMTKKSLISIGQLCNDGYDATFTADHVPLTKDGSTHITRHRNTTHGLWTISLLGGTPPTSTFPGAALAHSVYKMTTLQDLVIYLHHACFSPVPSTWIKAIDAGYFSTWPGLTSDLVRKHLPKSVATAKGHLRLDRKNVRSTQPTAPLPATEPTT